MSRLVALFLATFVSILPAQISPGGIVNIASFAPVGLPNANIGRGSLFTVFGQGLAGEGLARADEFPLPSELGGASIEVEVAGIIRSCPMIFTTPGQVAALLPSDVPAGEGVLRLTIDGIAYVEPLTVTDRSFGIFAQNQRGSGLAIFQNFVTQTEQPLNGPQSPIARGGAGTLWGVGLGPVSGDESAGPLPGDLGRDLELYVGGVEVTNILYAGRSGCCSGVDQIIFEIPAAAPQGCYVPVTVVVDGIPSNQGAISIGTGDFCGDFDSFSSAEVESIAADASFQFGRIDISRIDWMLQGQSLLEEQTSATFREFVGGQFLQNPSYLSSGRNTCLVRFGAEDPNSQGVTAPFDSLSAGPSINYTTPNDTRMMTLVDGMTYVDDIADLVLAGQPELSPGEYAFTGADAASTVGAFTAQAVVGAPLVWTNQSDFVTVDRDAGLTIRWQGGNPAERALVFGVSRTTNRADAVIFASFACDAAMSDQELFVPAYVLAALPPSGTTQVPGFGAVVEGLLQVGSMGIPTRFQAQGLDAGMVTHFFSRGVLGLAYR